MDLPFEIDQQIHTPPLNWSIQLWLIFMSNCPQSWFLNFFLQDLLIGERMKSWPKSWLSLSANTLIAWRNAPPLNPSPHSNTLVTTETNHPVLAPANDSPSASSSSHHLCLFQCTSFSRKCSNWLSCIPTNGQHFTLERWGFSLQWEGVFPWFLFLCTSTTIDASY